MPRSPLSYGRRAILIAAVTLAAGAPPAGAQRPAPRPAADHGRIEMNGRLLADVVLPADGDEVLLPVDAIIRAVDGDRPAEPSRLRLDGRRLYAAGVGGCADCLLRVARPVVISERLRSVSGVTVLPLADLVAALEGRVRRHPDTGVHEIFAGRCTWCILEPR